MCMHAHLHTLYIYTYVHTYAYTHAHIHVYALMHTYMHICSHSYIHTCAHMHAATSSMERPSGIHCLRASLLYNCVLECLWSKPEIYIIYNMNFIKRTHLTFSMSIIRSRRMRSSFFVENLVQII